MKTVILTDNKHAADLVYGEDQLNRLKDVSEFSDIVLTKAELEKNPALANETEIVFSTWGMPHFTNDEIKKYFPNLKAVLYGAGSVQGFAREFLECGVSVASAWMANGVPVAEFTFAQILLALKGYFSTLNTPKKTVTAPTGYTPDLKGSYRAKVGVCGVGAIGSMVCNLLKNTDCDVYAFDKYLSQERAAELGVKLTTLEDIFENCDVITNHLANKVELNDIYNYDVFKLMKPCSTFINTGRGAQVNEDDLVLAMKEEPTRTALLDVTWPEPMCGDSPMVDCPNILITPHIAGSIGNECRRMGDWMIDEYLRLEKGESLKYGVTLKMLATMA